MTPSQIISKSFDDQGFDSNQALQTIHEHLKRKNASILHFGDSVLVVIKIAPHDVEVHLYTQDKPLAMVKAVKHFMKQIKASHIQRVYGKADTRQIVDLMRHVGVKIRQSDKPQYNWMALVGEH
jgi:hypothetical protein